jgi:UDP-N-acetylmuramoyl-L-alanine---L-glutamate ligase
MKLEQLKGKSLLVLGLGLEGCAAVRFLRREFPEGILGVADQREFEGLSREAKAILVDDPVIHRHLGPNYLSALQQYEVTVKSPGIPVILPQYQEAVHSGRPITSPTAIFFANFPGTIVGVTGTKGKSTTSSMIAAVLRSRYPEVRLLGNIGSPALDLLPSLLPQRDALVVFELSSHQLEGLRQSPHIAVLLNVVPEHLDYYPSFDEYVSAKENIARFQSELDELVYDSDHEIPQRVALHSRARKHPCSMRGTSPGGCFVYDDWIACDEGAREPELIVPLKDIPLRGSFNRINVAAAVAVGRILGVPGSAIAAAIREFKPLPHRLEYVGEFDGVSYFNDSIATVPEATVAALDALAGGVETIILGGAERYLDFAVLAEGLVRHAVKNIILFPPTGERIWSTVVGHDPTAGAAMRHFFVDSMEEAVRLAKQHTSRGKCCLLSPAAPSFGLFRDFRDRGDRFKQLVQTSS